MKNSADVAVIGGGIVGLAHAYAALKKGARVVLFEREKFAVGASVRNFGLLWPIGQEQGRNLEIALKSREIWNEIAQDAGFWLNPNGSLHLAYHADEKNVLEEFCSIYKDSPYRMKLLTSTEVKESWPSVKPIGLKAALWSQTEATVNPREAIRTIPVWLKERYKLELRFSCPIQEIRYPLVKTSNETWRVEKIFVCPGVDFDTLYPELFRDAPITKCKLQMMKGTVTGAPVLGPTLCAGLTLRHYSAFSKCKSLAAVDERYNQSSPEFEKYGIHVLLAQNNHGELIIGDSHEYGRTLEPFDKSEIDQHILKYLSTFYSVKNISITERWHGIYPKLNGSTFMIERPEKNVVLVNGLGGAGMTLSFGLADTIMQQEL
jgi:D-hydroxyproline dehydrogenase subunit beta